MIDVEALTRPLSADAPCGPDLDAEGDLDYMNLMARVEGDLPGSFFSFDRTAVDFKSDSAALGTLLERSLDLRPVVMLAKLAILNRDLDGFAGWLTAARRLLAGHWAHVHPAAADGQAALRSAVLQSLDDLPTVVLPLQYAALATSRRFGPITFRHHLVALGEVARREGESEADAGAVEHALATTEAGEIMAVRDALARVVGAVEGIRTTWVAEAGFDDAPTLDRLAKLSGRMLAFVEEEVARRAPQDGPAPLDDALTGVGPEPIEGAAPPITGAPAVAAFRVDSARAASRAFAATIAYLLAHEPSSPALLLIQQAQQTVGLGFVGIMRLLMPDTIDEAKIVVGSEQPFVFRVDRMSDVEPVAEADEVVEDGPDPVIRSRRDVQSMLGLIAAFYRTAEPSSPIPLLCDRARGMCALDFATLLRDMMPKRS